MPGAQKVCSRFRARFRPSWCGTGATASTLNHSLPSVTPSRRSAASKDSCAWGLSCLPDHFASSMMEKDQLPAPSVLSQKYLGRQTITCFLPRRCWSRRREMAWRSAVGIELDEAERCELEARTRRRKISRADAMRAEIVLLAADGATNLAIAEQLGVTRVTVATWRKRFAANRLAGLADEPRASRTAHP